MRTGLARVGDRVPGYVVGGFLAAFSITQARRDPAGTDRWARAVETDPLCLDPGSRLRPIATAFLRNDLGQLAQAGVGTSDASLSRTDYIHLALARLVDHRHPVELDLLNDCSPTRKTRAPAPRCPGPPGDRRPGARRRRAFEVPRALPRDGSAAVRGPGHSRAGRGLRDDGGTYRPRPVHAGCHGDLDQAERVTLRR